MIDPVKILRPVGDTPPTATLYYGADCRETLRGLPEQSVHTVVTSPPYWGLRDYGIGEAQIGLERSPDEFVETLVEVFRETRRVLRDDGTLWLNLGDSYVSAPRGNKKEGGGNLTNSNIGSPVETNRLHSAKALNKSKVEGLKHKDLVGIPWMVAFALRADGWYLRSDIIWAKCLSGGTTLYARTQKGEMPSTLKDLVRLDPRTVQLWNGERWTQVLGFRENPRPEGVLEIEFRNGERIGCTPDHRWPTERGLLRSDELQVGDTIECTVLPEPENPRNPEALSDDDVGWLVGMYIAEGSRDSTYLHFASHEKETERFVRLEKIARAYDGTFRLQPEQEGHGVCASVSGPILHAIIDQYVSGYDAKTKHLHPRCWRRSNRFLEALLRGYLSGDSHREDQNSRWRLGFCKNDNLAQDLRAVSARLGWSCRLKRCQHQMDGRRFPGWRGDLKIERGEHWNAKKDGEIVEIRKSRARKFWDIEVADDPHLFALASGILTHNSSCMPESVTDRPTKAHEYLFLLSKQPKYYYDHEAIKEPGKDWSRGGPGTGIKETQHYHPDNGGNSGLSALARRYRDGSVAPMRNKRSWWNVNPRPYSGAHFAVFPPELIEPCVLAGCPPGGVVLDPFSGSGTAGLVALDHGRNYIGIDLNDDYLEMARARILGEPPPKDEPDAESGGILEFFG